MLNKCQLILATGGTVAQDLTMQWSTMGGFMQELSLMVIDEGQQYGSDREIAVISLLRQQPLVLCTGDSEQTPGGIDRAAPKNMGCEVTEIIICQLTSQTMKA